MGEQRWRLELEAVGPREWFDLDGEPIEVLATSINALLRFAGDGARCTRLSLSKIEQSGDPERRGP